MIYIYRLSAQGKMSFTRHWRVVWYIGTRCLGDADFINDIDKTKLYKSWIQLMNSDKRSLLHSFIPQFSYPLL